MSLSFLLLTCTFAACWPQAGAPAPVALVISVKGDVEVLARDGQKEAASSKRRLYVDERLSAADRTRVVDDLLAMRLRHPKFAVPQALIEAYAAPPDSPADCVFARITRTISADLTTKITPCQFGGTPDCSNCGCIASAGLAALARHRLWGFVPVGSIFTRSVKIGQRVKRLRPAESAA